jgi:hypothetical protein
MRLAPIKTVIRRIAVALAIVPLCLPISRSLQAQTQAPSYRTISGVITDDSHEPLRGAVVELENQDSHTIVSYLTQNDGRYTFKRLDSHTDFQLWATFRGNKSPTHTISKFDDHLNKVIDIKCKTF